MCGSACTVKKVMKCGGDSEILREIFRDNTRISTYRYMLFRFSCSIANFFRRVVGTVPILESRYTSFSF